MAITLKKLSVHSGLSQETLAYTADVYWSGRKIGSVRNDGNGGTSIFWRDEKAAKDDLAAARAHATAQPVVFDGKPWVVDGQQQFHNDIEDWCDTLANEMHNRKTNERRLTRMLKAGTVFGVSGKEGVFSIKRPFSPQIEKAVTAQVLKEHGTDKVIFLNKMTLVDAVDYFLTHAPAA